MNQDNSEKKINNETIQQIITITITVFVSCLIISSFFFAMCKLDTDNFERWIGFCGSIIGGAMTLVGVVWTIRYEKESQIEKNIDKNYIILKKYTINEKKALNDQTMLNLINMTPLSKNYSCDKKISKIIK